MLFTYVTLGSPQNKLSRQELSWLKQWNLDAKYKQSISCLWLGCGPYFGARFSVVNQVSSYIRSINDNSFNMNII